MVKIYKQPFAHDGDTIAIPDVSQPDGKMSNADGWTPDYQLPSGDPNYKPVDRQEMNGVFKEVTEALGQVQVQGAASWSADGAPYPINAQVYHGGKQWLALRPNSVEPDEGEDWSGIGNAATKDVGTTAGTVAAGNDSRIVNAVPNSRTIIAGEGLTGGGNLTDNRTISIASSHIPIGVGQTWQDVLTSRSLNVTYTNTTGRPIQVSISVTNGSNSGGNARFIVDGVTISSDESSSHSWSMSIFAVIPIGASYRLNATLPSTGRVSAWSELR